MNPVRGDWVVTQMPEGVVLDAPPTIAFGDDDRVSGHTGVNRFSGSYALAGDTLTVGPLAMTRMAGPPENTFQEGRLVAALTEPLAVAADGDALTLTSGGTVIRLARSAQAEPNA